jgi:2-oxoglutarate dehydrogenase E2 component (dihydrolipoamide succinyltransferase)
LAIWNADHYATASSDYCIWCYPEKPAVIETPQGDLIGIRQKMFISHSYDHRVVDGSLGGQFVKRVSDYLEGFDPKRNLI